MRSRLLKPAIVAALVTAFVAPAALAGVGTSPSSHWSFKVRDDGVWFAQGAHVSFSWNLKPFEVYNFRVDGTLLFGELSFPVDASDYMTEGATFKVMMGKEKLFQLNDNPAVDMDLSCAMSPPDPNFPPDPCDIAFPESATFEVYQRGHVTQYHIEAGVQDNGIAPCIKVSTQGESSLDGSTIMFTGGVHFRVPPGLTMADEGPEE